MALKNPGFSKNFPQNLDFFQPCYELIMLTFLDILFSRQMNYAVLHSVCTVRHFLQASVEEDKRLKKCIDNANTSGMQRGDLGFISPLRITFFSSKN